jgi:hypothetical protein
MKLEKVVQLREVAQAKSNNIIMQPNTSLGAMFVIHVEQVLCSMMMPPDRRACRHQLFNGNTPTALRPVWG